MNSITIHVLILLYTSTVCRFWDSCSTTALHSVTSYFRVFIPLKNALLTHYFSLNIKFQPAHILDCCLINIILEEAAYFVWTTWACDPRKASSLFIPSAGCHVHRLLTSPGLTSSLKSLSGWSRARLNKDYVPLTPESVKLERGHLVVDAMGGMTRLGRGLVDMLAQLKWQREWTFMQFYLAFTLSYGVYILWRIFH